MIVAGVKTIENRTRPTRYRGRLLIHASRTIDSNGMALVAEAAADVGEMMIDEWPTGAIIGCVTVADCVTASEDEFFEGPYGYVLADAVTFERPLPARGQLGIYDTPSITAAMAAAMLGKSPTTIRAQLAALGIGQKWGRDYLISGADLTRLEAVPGPGRPKIGKIP